MELKKPNLLMVPMRIDALYLTKDKTVVSPNADFTKLPFSAEDEEQVTQDYNSGTAYLSEAILSTPFQNQNLTLKKGVHLHWALPDTLATIKEENFPAIPNRWLVAKKDLDTGELVEQWVIESDCLFEDNLKEEGIVNVPLPDSKNGKPYCFLGGKWTLPTWQMLKGKMKYWEDEWKEPLTAAGYGNPTFASFYPNSMSVFGLWDDTNIQNTNGFEYEVIGWYNETKNDAICQFMTDEQKQEHIIEKHDLNQIFHYRAELTWQEILKSGYVLPTGNKLNLPSMDGLKGDDKIVHAFLAPAAVQFALDKNLLIKSPAVTLTKTSFNKALTIGWSELTSEKPDAWLTPLTINFAKVNLPNLTKPLKGDLAKWADILGEGLKNNSKNLVTKTALTTAFAQIKDIWIILLKSEAINAIDATNASVGLNLKTKLKSTTIEPVEQAKVIDYLTSSERELVTSKKILEISFPDFFMVSLWSELIRVEIITHLEKADDSGEMGLLSTSLVEKWKKLNSVYQPIVSALKEVVNGTNVSRLLPKKRLNDRYGESSWECIWNRLVEKKWINEIFKNQDYALIDRSFADAPVKTSSPQKSIDELISKLDINDLSIYPEMKHLLENDILNYWLFEGHQLNRTIKTEAFSNRFSHESPNYDDYTKKGWVIPVNGMVDWEKLKPFLPTISPDSNKRTSLEDVFYQFPKKQKILSLAEVIEKFDAITELIWKQYFEQKWLLLIQGQLQNKTLRRALPSKFEKELPVIKKLIPETIQKNEFLKQFGLDNGALIWEELINHAIITVESNEAAIPEKIDLEKLKAVPVLKKHLDEILVLLEPKIGRERILANFSKNGAEIWDALLEYGWLKGIVAEKGRLNSSEPWITAPRDLPYYEWSVEHIELSTDKKVLEDLTQEMHWVAGVVIPKTEGEVSFSKELWKELQTKGWLNKVPEGDEKAFLQPRDNRKPIDPLFNHEMPLVHLRINNQILKTNLPGLVCCFGKVKLTKDSSKPNPELQQPEVNLTLANTSTEVLSTSLANHIDPVNKELITDQLEAILLERKMGNQQLDIAARFDELRHEKEFKPIHGGEIWQIVYETTNKTDQNVSGEMQEVIPEALAKQLNSLNLLQKKYERQLDEIKDLRTTLFTDWYKYQLALYPPEFSGDQYPNVSDIQRFIERMDLIPLEQLINATGQLLTEQTEGIISHAYAANLPEGDPDNMLAQISLANELASFINSTIEQINDLNETAISHGGKYRYTLKSIPGPNFWQPTEPTLGIEGPLMKSNLRHGKDGRFRLDDRLQCHTPEHTLKFSFKKDDFDISAIRQYITSLMEYYGNSNWIGYQEVTEQPWHALNLEWQVDFKPVHDPSENTPTNPLGYDSDFILENYNLPENNPDFVPKDLLAPAHGNSYYTHSTLLNDFAQPYYAKQLQRYLAGYLGVQPREVDWTQAFLEEMLTNRAKKLDHHDVDKDPVYNAIRALMQLLKTSAMTQVLSGFNQELIMQKETMQIPVGDPLGFTGTDKYVGQTFAGRVKKAVGNANVLAPEPQNDFNPIRAGRFQVRHLRLIDTFGQTCDLKLQNILKPLSMQDELREDYVRLKPRLAQPARLNLRWLSANSDLGEMNTHPASSPIFGWVVPNYLDNDLMVYTADGSALLIFTPSGDIKPPLGKRNESPTEIIDGIENEHLKAFCTYIYSHSHEGADRYETTFLSDFLSAVQSSLNNIHPEFFARHKDISLLMGRPMALTRISMGIEHQGLPAVNHDWAIFRSEMEKVANNTKPYRYDQLSEMIRNLRETYQIDKVKFPVVLGDHLQLNDSLVAYWSNPLAEKTAKVTFPNTHFKPHSTSEDIETGAEKLPFIEQTLESGQREMTLLFDPTGVLHAKSGILPTKIIDIPEGQYIKAIQKIKISFLAAPLLTPRGKIKISLPEEVGYQWSWEGFKENAYLKTPYLAYSTFESQWSRSLENLQAKSLWSYLIEQVKCIEPAKDQLSGVLLPLTDDMIKIINKDKTWKPFLFNIMTLWQTLINQQNGQELSLAAFQIAWGRNQKNALETWLLELWNYLAQPDIYWLKITKGQAAVVPEKDRVSKTLPDIAPDKVEFVTAFLKSLTTPVYLKQFKTDYIRKKRNNNGFPLWKEMEKLKWIVPDTPEIGHIALSKEAREKTVVPKSFEPFKEALSELLELHKTDLEPISELTGFTGQQEIKDGWLTLKPE